MKNFTTREVSDQTGATLRQLDKGWIKFAVRDAIEEHYRSKLMLLRDLILVGSIGALAFCWLFRG